MMRGSLPAPVAWARAAWHDFWFSPSPAEALGLARACFFGTLFLVYAREDFTGWGSVDPVFWHPVWLFRVFGLAPASPAALSVMQVLFRGSLVLAAVGLFTRPATIVACLLGVYLFGLPHNFGHTYHFDALLVFVLLILACSRAGDGFSLDARRRGHPAEPGPEYTWPVRLVWVAMALVFFAAGLAKLRHGGVPWFASDNLAIVLTKAHYHVSDADPIGPWGLWIASSPIASSTLAFVSLVTETLFPLALVSRRARAVLVPAAFGMLVGIRILMGPTFGGFLTAFSFWVPWTRAIEWHTARPRERYAMLFDGSCGLCQRTVQVVRRLDVLDRIDVLDVARDWPSVASRYPGLSQAACLEDMHLVTPRGDVETGFDAYRVMARSIPAAWPIMPLLYLPGARAIGRRVYRAVARHRLSSSCAVDPGALRSPEPRPPHA
jgi:predicted DCC family thiol-disulfide oxidoreductase YuxK